MTTLVEFLRARLDEDERVAHAAAGQTWRTEDSESEDVFVLTEDDEYVVGLWDGGRPSGGATVDDAAHLARHDPARVLAEVEAKRRIMRLHDVLGGSLTGVGRWTYCETCHTNSAGEIDADATEASAPCATLRLLALPYVDHLDYDPEWGL